jgi:undecaprenyl-diphosphatase
MGVLESIVLGLVQGLTEFVPVSSSGHLVLVPWLLGWPEPTLLFDTMVHWGTLLAILACFWRDWWQMTRAWLRGFRHWDWRDPQARLMWLLVLATVPAVVLGFLFEDLFESLFSEPVLVSVFLLITAGLLALGEWLGRRTRGSEDLRWPDALIIGLAQAAAIAPGISRAGATMAAGLLRGLKRTDAARFSFLMATPIIFGAGLLQLGDAFTASHAQGELLLVAVGTLVAAVSGYAAIRFLLRYLNRHSLYIFSAYCLWVGVSCLIVASLRG